MIPVHLSSSGRSASWPVVVGSGARQTEHDNIDMMLYTVLPMVPWYHDTGFKNRCPYDVFVCISTSYDDMMTKCVPLKYDLTTLYTTQ